MNNPAEWAIVALGSNLENPAEQVRNAISSLRELSSQPLVESSLYRSTPVDCPPDSPEFVNAVVGLVPLAGETPESLLAKLQLTERKFGRIRYLPRKVLNAPRPMDLDLLAFRLELRSTPELTLPHPRAHLRRFVLQPLTEIAPSLVLPGQEKTTSELLGALGTDERVTKM